MLELHFKSFGVVPGDPGHRQQPGPLEACMQKNKNETRSVQHQTSSPDGGMFCLGRLYHTASAQIEKFSSFCSLRVQPVERIIGLERAQCCTRSKLTLTTGCNL